MCVFFFSLGLFFHVYMHSGLKMEELMWGNSNLDRAMMGCGTRPEMKGSGVRLSSPSKR